MKWSRIRLFLLDLKVGRRWIGGSFERSPFLRGLAKTSLVVALLAAGGLSGWLVYATIEATMGRWETIVDHAAIAHESYAPTAVYDFDMTALDRADLYQGLSTRLGAPINPPAIIHDEEDYKLVDGRWLSGSTGPAAQLIYEDEDGGRMMLFITSKPRREPTATMSYVERNGVGVSYWSAEPFAYTLSGDLDDTEVMKLWVCARVVYTYSDL